MGYYSEVALCLTKEAHTAFQAKIAEAESGLKKEVEDMLKGADFHEHEDAVLYYWTWIKWYDNFQDVKFILNFIQQDELGSDEMSEHYRFIRLGENYEDIEEEGSFWDNPFSLEVKREIDFIPPNKNTETNRE